MKQFYINGNPLYFSKEFTIIELLTFFNLNIRLVILEHNEMILPSKFWNSTFIKEQDKLEFLSIVGGG